MSMFYSLPTLGYLRKSNMGKPSLYYSQTRKSIIPTLLFKVSKSTQWLSQQGGNLTGINALNELLFILSGCFFYAKLSGFPPVEKATEYFC